MSEMIKLGGRTVSVHALTMKEIRDVLAALRDVPSGGSENDLLVKQVAAAIGVDLTLLQIKDIYRVVGEHAKSPHVLDMVFDDDIPAVAVSAASGLSLAELEGDFTQQEIRDLLDKVRAINPFFVGMMERLCRAGMTPSAPSPVLYVA